LIYSLSVAIAVKWYGYKYTTMKDTTYGRDADRARREGRKGDESAKGDAMGELYCECCGLKRYGKKVCKECGADYKKRVEASNSDEYPKDLTVARRENNWKRSDSN